MNELVYVTGLNRLLEENGVKDLDQNFETLYSRLHEDPTKETLCLEINVRLQEYFRELVLPEYPTIYDYLVLSLRDKDVIATFNWDPLLGQAWERNYEVSRNPTLLYLHGCVSLGWCADHFTQGNLGGQCHVCGKDREPLPLMYPVERKNYLENLYIRTQWENLEAFLSESYLLTIFGYSAPTTDVGALELMKKAWGRPDDRWREEIEIIERPGCSDDEVSEKWVDFIHTHHYQMYDDFFKSMLARSPRRTVEVQKRRIMDRQVYEPNYAPRGCTLRELQEWHTSLIQVET